MKKYIIVVTLLCFFLGEIYSQSCLPEGITFTSQEQVDSFQINYPLCNEIEGSVTLDVNIQNLEGLESIIAIGGNLNINAIFY